MTFVCALGSPGTRDASASAVGDDSSAITGVASVNESALSGTLDAAICDEPRRDEGREVIISPVEAFASAEAEETRESVAAGEETLVSLPLDRRLTAESPGETFSAEPKPESPGLLMAVASLFFFLITFLGALSTASAIDT